MDTWGNFAVIDTVTNDKLGFVKRNIISAFAKDTWELYNTSNDLVGKIEVTSTVLVHLLKNICLEEL